MAMSREDRNRRARERYRRKHWPSIDFPAPKDGKLHQPLLSTVAEKNPLIVTKYVRPEPKPRTARKKTAAKDLQPRMQW